METSIYLEKSFATSLNKTFNSDIHFNQTCTSDVSSSMKKLQRKPEITRRKNSSRGRKQSLNSIFAGFYSPKQFDIKQIQVSQCIVSGVLQQTTNFQQQQNYHINKQHIPPQQSNILKRLSTRQYEKCSQKQNQQNHDKEIKVIKIKNKKLEDQVKKLNLTNNQLQQKVFELNSELKDIQKRLQFKEADIKQYLFKQKNQQIEVNKLKQQIKTLEKINKDQQNELQLLDRKYLQVQIQYRQIKRNKDSHKKQHSQYSQKIMTLEQIVKQKDQQLYKLIAQNQKINCQMWIKQQKLHELQNSLTFKKDAFLQKTNKKLRLVNKQLIHRVNYLLKSTTSIGSSDVSFELSPQK